jgi:hypothetical protein
VVDHFGYVFVAVAHRDFLLDRESIDWCRVKAQDVATECTVSHKSSHSATHLAANTPASIHDLDSFRYNRGSRADCHSSHVFLSTRVVAGLRQLRMPIQKDG